MSKLILTNLAILIGLGMNLYEFAISLWESHTRVLLPAWAPMFRGESFFVYSRLEPHSCVCIQREII